MQRSAVPTEGITFEDQFGETRIIHHNKSANGPLRVKRVGTTAVLELNREAARGMGEIVADLRRQRGWSMDELAERAGLRGGKQTIYRIERSFRSEGVRLGTLYALAIAFGVEVGALLPSVEVTRHVVVQRTVRRLEGVA
jgi:DNA-binding XRE family transcriptional regulator